jgi:imidazolonepropionase-like amidohydrolase
MRSINLLTVLILVSATGLACAADDPGERPLVFQGVNLVPMDEERITPDQTVVIREGRIAEIRDAGTGELPANARVIEGRGRYLMPGLAEMHAHVPSSSADEQLRRDIMFLYLSNGITLARGMLGEPWHLMLRDKLADGSWAGPHLITSGPSLNGNSVESPDAGARMAREQAEAGYDFLKLHPGLTRAEFDAIVAAADAAGIPFAGHVSADVGVPRALEAGYASIDHFDRYMETLVDEEVLDEVTGGFFGYLLAPHVESRLIGEIARRTAEAGVWNVPTETLMHNALTVEIDGIREARPEFRYLPPDMVDGWISRVRQMRASEGYDAEAAEAFIDVRKQLIRALHEAGAGLLLGSDAPQILNVPGFSIHHEMKVMRDAGLSPYEVLRTGTANPAVFFGQQDEFGRIAEGLRADLVLLAANPLDDLDNVRRLEGVMINGRWHDRSSIDSMLEDIAARYVREED